MSPLYRGEDGVIYVDGRRVWPPEPPIVFPDMREPFERLAEAFRRMGDAYRALEPDLPKTSSKGHWRDVVPRSIRGRDR